MPEAQVNGTRLYYEVSGDGEPLVLVHGSWADATVWQQVVRRLSDRFRVLAYDRRGHSRSERPAGPGSYDEDGDDLAALLGALDLAPAHVVANSSGGTIALRLAVRRPELFRSLCCHEPPLWSLLEDDPATDDFLARTAPVVAAVGARIAEGDHEGAARQFVEEVIFGPGAWDALPAETRTIMVQTAPTFLDELNDPNQTTIDRKALQSLPIPVRFTEGTASPRAHAAVTDRLVDLIPEATKEVIERAGHVPQLTDPARYVEVLTRLLSAEVV